MQRPAALLIVLALAAASARAADPFVIHCVDDQTGRGIPLVELETVNHIRLYSDSAGVVAFDEPGLMHQRVYFSVTSSGYTFHKDGFGFAGVRLDIKPGGSATVKLHRDNIAERLYRVTGQGIYADSLRAGLDTPIKQPALNGQVMGQDSVLTAIYHGKIYWFWGDTLRPSYPLGHFGTAAATSDLPSHGGLHPGVGVNLDYLVDEHGFSRPMFKLDKPGPVWIDGVATVKDDAGRERLICHYSRMKDLGHRAAQGLAVFNDDAGKFDVVKTLPLDAPLYPRGHVLHVTDHGVDYLYFADAYAITRVKADWASVMDVSQYEAWTKLDDGRYGWQRGAAPLDKHDAWFDCKDADTGKPITLQNGTVQWNAYRKRYILIVSQIGGHSMLGEVWYAEATRPQGPFRKAVKIATHDKYSFYNPTQHAMFDADGGRVIYFEGTYAATFSGNDHPTPRYDYNQMMYRLDLSDPRLKPAHADDDQPHP